MRDSAPRTARDAIPEASTGFALIRIGDAAHGQLALYDLAALPIITLAIVRVVAKLAQDVSCWQLRPFPERLKQLEEILFAATPSSFVSIGSRRALYLRINI